MSIRVSDLIHSLYNVFLFKLCFIEHSKIPKFELGDISVSRPPSLLLSIFVVWNARLRGEYRKDNKTLHELFTNLFF